MALTHQRFLTRSKNQAHSDHPFPADVLEIALIAWDGFDIGRHARKSTLLSPTFQKTEPSRRNIPSGPKSTPPCNQGGGSPGQDPGHIAVRQARRRREIGLPDFQLGRLKTGQDLLALHGLFLKPADASPTTGWPFWQSASSPGDIQGFQFLPRTFSGLARPGGPAR
jgi:hypothetical protein